MKVRCITDNSNSFINSDNENVYYVKNKHFDVNLGREYVVYGLAFYDGFLHYCICEYSASYYPAPLFEILDNRPSEYWVFNYVNSEYFLSSNSYAADPYPIWTFKEWAFGCNFYSNLADCCEWELTVFDEYKRKMDLEFPDPTVTASAISIDHEWVMCQECFDGWKCTSTTEAIIICCNCDKKLNNPRFDR